MSIIISPYLIGNNRGHVVIIDHVGYQEYMTSFCGANSKVDALTYAASLAAKIKL